MARDKGQVHRLIVLGSFPRTEEHLSLETVDTGKTESPRPRKKGPVCL